MSKRILFYDTETTGLHKPGAKPNEYEKWPHIVQISYMIYSLTASQLATGIPSTWSPSVCGDYIVYPDGYDVPVEASQIHGISHARAVKDGSDIREVMKDFLYQIAQADVIVAHNANFDKNTVHAVLSRIDMLPERGAWVTKDGASEVCTMLAATEMCRLPFPVKLVDITNTTVRPSPYPKDTRFKWPRLSELFVILFPHEPLPTGLHNSLIDVRCTARCFFRLLEMGTISPLNPEHPDESQLKPTSMEVDV